MLHVSKLFRAVGLILPFLFFTSFVKADHIVGGNLEMIAKDNVPGRYTMRLIIFQNEEIGTGGNESSNQGFMIYRTRDNQKMKFVIADIANFGEGNVVYFNDSCSQNRRLKTRKLVYEETVNLDPALYDDPAGYYVVWADGYRNLGLNNITNPYNTGIMLQLKFPPLKRNGQPFLNSSASFNEINGEYLCVNMPFSLHFDAKDQDGDELRYSLVTPFDNFQGGVDVSESEYKGMSSYPLVNYVSGYNATQAMHGNPELVIDSQTGILNVTPTELGLFVFTVQVDEYRKGEWIGSTRRDYQFLVIDCPPMVPPQPQVSVKGFPAGIVSASICYGQQAELVAELNASWTYQWRKDGRYIMKANGNSVKVTEPGLYSVEIAYKTTCGRSIKSKEIDILVLGSKTLIGSTSRTVCEGKTTELFTAESPGLKYTWFKDGELLSVPNRGRLTVSEGGLYKVQVEDISQSCPISESADIEITSLMPPIASISANPNTTLLCEGDVLTLRVTLNAGNIYQWQKDGFPVASSNNIYSATKSGIYTVTVTDGNGCRNVSDPFNAEFKKQIAVVLNPISDVCEGSTAVVQLSGYPAGGIYSGKGVAGDIFDVRAAGKGNHEITYTITGGMSCAQGTAVQSVMVDAPPLPFLPERIRIGKGQSVELKADMGSQYIYNWSPSEGLSAVDIANPSASPEKTTVYSVILTDDNGCSMQKAVTVSISANLYIPDVFSPNGDGLNDEWLLYGLADFEDLQVFIYNRWGTLVFYSQDYLVPWDGSYEGEKVQGGIYPYRILAKDGHEFKGTVSVLY